MMQRRAFLTALTAGVFVPQFERWYRRGIGLLVPAPVVVYSEYDLTAILRDIYAEWRLTAFPVVAPLLDAVSAQRGTRWRGKPAYFDMVVPS